MCAAVYPALSGGTQTFVKGRVFGAIVGRTRGLMVAVSVGGG